MTKQKIGLVGLDLDGTLLNAQHKISPRNRETIARAIRSGCLVIPATGRPLRGLPQEFLDIPGVDWAVTANGATVTDLTGKQEPLHFWIPTEHWFKARETVQDMDCVIDLFVDGYGYSTESLLACAEDWAPTGMADYIRQSRKAVPDVAEFARTLKEVEKANIFFENPEERLIARKRLEELGLFSVTSSAFNNLELNALGVNKGRALLALARQLGLEPSQVMACGDSDNDAAMIRTVGVGVAMGNATPEVKAIADYVTDTNLEDGVAKAIEILALGEEGSGVQKV